MLDKIFEQRYWEIYPDASLIGENIYAIKRVIRVTYI